VAGAWTAGWGACGHGTAHLDDKRCPTPTGVGDGEQNRRVLECMQRVPRPGNDQEVAVASLPLGGVGNQPHPSPQHLDGRLAGILVLRQHRPRRSTRSASAAAHAHAHRRPSRRPGRPERSLPSSSGRGYAPRARTSPYRQCGHPAARPSITRTVRAGRHLRGGQIRALLPTKLSPRSLAGTRGWLLPPDTPAGGASVSPIICSTPLPLDGVGRLSPVRVPGST
jgi:hypothetical protein